MKTTSKNLQCGFSLLEVMLVVLVLGIVAAMVTLNYEAATDRRHPDELIEAMLDWCDLMRQESIMRQQALGVKFQGKNAQFFVYAAATGKWLPLRLPHYFSPDILTQAETMVVQTASGDPGPVFLPNGQMRAFTMNAKFSDGKFLGIKGTSEGTCIKIEQ